MYIVIEVAGALNIPVLEMVDVRKTYDGESDVLTGVSLAVEAGESVLISGRNGSGKTTLLNIAGCLDTPTEGEVSVNGRKVVGLKERELSEIRLRTIGFVFQDHNLMEELTVEQNIMLPLRLAKSDRMNERTMEILEGFGVASLSSRRPMELSTGQRQLVAVARALANGPSLLLADEPVASLDEENSSLVLAALRKVKDTALVMTCQDRDARIESPNMRRYALQEGRLTQL